MLFALVMAQITRHQHRKPVFQVSFNSANKQIAADLSITESMVKTHVANIFQKLEVNHRTEAVTKAMSHCIIKL